MCGAARARRDFTRMSQEGFPLLNAASRLRDDTQPSACLLRAPNGFYLN